eukprot:TRINITY_DN32382_c0_g1_i1.p3 TRINITY_DN32382_c0_g1~~TRINITY_DN32382_c0_g1_i1.p3  ORF type:complete len:50 (-),score=11.31 TRINITY_DN32382_c0_g1_i1:297-446(-)
MAMVTATITTMLTITWRRYCLPGACAVFTAILPGFDGSTAATTGSLGAV